MKNRVRIDKRTLLSIAIVLAVFALIPLLPLDSYLMHIVVTTYLFAALALSWSLVGGFMGQISFAHMAYYGLGAYTGGLLYSKLGVSPWIGMIAAAGVCVIACLIISYPTLKIRGPFFVLITIAFLNICRVIANYWKGLTNGSIGIMVNFKPGFGNMIFRSKLPYAYITLALLAITILVTYYLQNSKIGYQIIALRDNREAAQSLGVNPTTPRLTIVCVSAALAGMLGVLYMQYALFLDPETAFSIATCTKIMLIAIVGGVGTLWGPVIGAVMLVPVTEILRNYLSATPGLDQLIYGVILVALILIQPNGITGGAAAISARRKRKKAVKLAALAKAREGEGEP